MMFTFRTNCLNSRSWSTNIRMSDGASLITNEWGGEDFRVAQSESWRAGREYSYSFSNRTWMSNYGSGIVPSTNYFITLSGGATMLTGVVRDFGNTN